MKEEGVSMPAGERQAAGETMDPGGGGLWGCLLAGEKMIGELYQSEHITWDDAALTPAEKNSRAYKSTGGSTILQCSISHYLRTVNPRDSSVLSYILSQADVAPLLTTRNTCSP